MRDLLSTLRYRSRRRLRLLAMAVSGGAVELFGSGAPNVTMAVTEAVTAGRLVEVATTADRSVRLARSLSTKVMGVAKQTASAVGDQISVATGGVWMLTAEGAVTAGDLVVASADNDGTIRPMPTIDVTATPTESTIEAGFADALAVIGIALADIADEAEGPVLLKGLS